MERRTPTPAAARCLAAIKELLAEGKAPSLGNLAVRLDIAKTSVRQSLARLKRWGWIRIGPLTDGVGRVVEIIPEPAPKPSKRKPKSTRAVRAASMRSPRRRPQ